MDQDQARRGDYEYRMLAFHNGYEPVLGLRTVFQQWQGDSIVDSTVGPRLYPRNRDELTVFALAFADKVWFEYIKFLNGPDDEPDADKPLEFWT